MVYIVNVFCLAMYIYYMYKLYSYTVIQLSWSLKKICICKYQILVNTFICFNGNWQQNEILLNRRDGFGLL